VLLRSILSFLLVLMAFGPAWLSSDSAQSSVLPAFLYTVARTYEPMAWMSGSDRFASNSTIFVRDGKVTRRLVPDFAVSADPSVSYDGLHILFAGKAHASDPWQIWEVATDGMQPRRVTATSDDCLRPFYLPDDRIVYARKVENRFVIEALDLGGGKPLRLTYGPADYLPTDVLRDGRILFEASYPLGTSDSPEIYTVYSDGSGVESYRCDHGAARHSGRQANSGDIVFASAQGLATFTSALAHETHVPAPAGEYAGDVAETQNGILLLSWRREPKGPFRLMQWTPGANELQPVLADPDSSLVQPTLLAPHAVPKRHPSGLHDWPNANLLCLNAYTSKYQFAPGSIHSARFYTRDGENNLKLLGTAPVESDGSFFVQVPTELPLQIELLDAAGKTLKREAGFFWMRRGEQRACVGCHAGPETAPENAVPKILLKSTTPSAMTEANTQISSGGH